MPISMTLRDNSIIKLQVPIAELRSAIQSQDSHGRIAFSLPNQKQTRHALLQKIDLEAMTQNWLTASFREVGNSDMVKVDVPILLIGHNEIADGKGAAMIQPTDHLHIKGKVSDLPEHLEIDISHMQIGDHISVANLKLKDGLEILSNPETVIATLKPVYQEPEPELQVITAEPELEPEA